MEINNPFPSNLDLPSLTQDQRGICYAEALRNEIAGKPGEDSSATRRRLQAQYGVFKGATAAQAERLLQEYPELVAEIKDGSRKLPKLPDEWAALKKKAMPKPNPEPENSATPTPTPKAAAPTTPKPVLIPFDPPGGSPLEPHPLAAPFPLIEGEEFAELVADLRKNGLLQPIVVYQDKILDGRNRDRGCIEAEVTPRYVEYTGDDPLRFVIAANLRRRHLDVGQRAMIAAKLATAEEGRPENRSNSISLEEAAERLQVSRTSAVEARAIAKADPKVADEVAAGKLSLNAGVKKAGIKGQAKAKPTKPAKKNAPALASPVTTALENVTATLGKDTSVLIPRCEEWLKAMHADFPQFTLHEIAFTSNGLANRMMVQESGIAAK